ncbi:hypothetical protein ACV1BL_16520 [Serratia marcescens]|nr:hypothetical protein [uncultured Serratia sp.]
MSALKVTYLKLKEILVCIAKKSSSDNDDYYQNHGERKWDW